MQTAEEIESPELSDYEKERGKPMPNISHAVVQANIIMGLGLGARGKYLIASELTLELPNGSVLIPDISVLPKRTLDYGGEPIRCREVPVLIVEIYSPTQGYQDIMAKLKVYFAQGVQSVWTVEPANQAIAVFAPGQARPRMFQEGEITDPATGLTVRLEEIFA